MSTIWKNGKY
jgi:polyhydroxyalkanoate synthesis regulator phasin